MIFHAFLPQIPIGACKKIHLKRFFAGDFTEFKNVYPFEYSLDFIVR